MYTVSSISLFVVLMAYVGVVASDFLYQMSYKVLLQLISDEKTELQVCHVHDFYPMDWGPVECF